jgi:hypothetical protein
VWVDGEFAWLSDWPLSLCYQPDTLVTDVHGSHPRLGLRLQIQDAVDCERNVLMRRFVVTRPLQPLNRRVRTGERCAV